MNVSGPAIRSAGIATTLLTIALLLAGGLAYTQLPVSPLAANGFSSDLRRCARYPAPALRPWLPPSPLLWSASSDELPPSTR